MDDISSRATPTLNVSDVPLWRGEHPKWLEIIILVIIWTMCIWTIIGNGLVLATFIRFPHIRNKVSNLYILNLSLSDFIIGCVALPLANSYRQNGIWKFGETVCKFWLVVDWAACFVSVWAIVLISYDRFQLVNKGIEYDKFQTRKKFYILSGTTWVLCFLRYTCGFIVYDLNNPNNIDYSIACDHPTLKIFPLVLFDYIVTICFPVLLTAIFNVHIYINIFKRSRGLVRVSAEATHQVATLNSGVDISIQDPRHSDDVIVTSITNPIKREGTNDIRKLRRSAVTLALIVGVSFLSWSPYYGYIFATTVFRTEVNIIVILFTYYIWWGNSACNPLLFVATHPGIRNGIAKILRIRK